MKFTLSWLKQYLDTDAELNNICDNLTNIGLEVESCDDQKKSLSIFSVAKIIEVKKHENSDKLKICQVETIDSAGSSKMLQIICGASNARLGLKVVYAPIGAVIPESGMIIKKAKIAGVESFGMLCSAQELGLEGGDGIIEIDEKFAIGSKITDIFNKNDAVIEINVTPNRGDCLGVYGIARDLAATGLGRLKKLSIEKKEAQFSLPISIKNSAPHLCNLAAFRLIKNVKNCESPKWLKEQLAMVGINSISAIVDITNYVMLSLNRPMHAYDASKINGSINIRLARLGEEMVSLKDDELILDETMLVVSDDKKSLGIAGIIGSKHSSCDLSTTQILLESAYFDPISIATTGRALNILTDARYRFERGVNMLLCEQGIDLATNLILEICGGEVSETKILEGEKKYPKKIIFNPSLIKKITGIDVSLDEVWKILQSLEFGLKNIAENQIEITVPSHRHDIDGARDIVEEVIRIYGYNKIQPQKIDFIPAKFCTDIFDKVRLALISNGFIENINWSFCDHNLVDFFASTKVQLTIANPISAELDHMRPNLLIGLIQSYQKNSLRNFNDISFFEIGKIFTDIDEGSQKLMISGLRSGKNKLQNHYNDQRDFDIFDVKKDFFDCVEIFGLKPSSLQIIANEAPKYYHPHRSATLKLGKNIIGYFGEIHPKVAKKFAIKNAINVFEIFVDSLPQSNFGISKSVVKKSFIFNDLQFVERDFAFLFDKRQSIGDVVKTIENCDKNIIKKVDIFDIYSGKNIEEDKKSVALRVLIQPLEKTLNSEEIEALSKKIIDSVVKNYQAQLRI